MEGKAPSTASGDARRASLAAFRHAATDTHLLDYLVAAYRHRYLAASVFCVVILLALVQVFTTTPLYRAQSRIIVEVEDDQVSHLTGVHVGRELPRSGTLLSDPVPDSHRPRAGAPDGPASRSRESARVQRHRRHPHAAGADARRRQSARSASAPGRPRTTDPCPRRSWSRTSCRASRWSRSRTAGWWISRSCRPTRNSPPGQSTSWRASTWIRTPSSAAPT